MNRLAGMFLMSVALSASASSFNPAAELAKRTGLSVGEIETLVKDCDANQTSMNVCAWYDQVKAEHHLQMALKVKRAACPHCRDLSESSIADWQRQRDHICKETAQREWSNGSMEPAAESMCITADTKKKIEDISAKKCN
jgi:hypothetical protein